MSSGPRATTWAGRWYVVSGWWRAKARIGLKNLAYNSAYRSAEIEAALKEKGLRSRIHRKGRRNKPLRRLVQLERLAAAV